MAVILTQVLPHVPPSYLNERDHRGWCPLHLVAANKDEAGVRPQMIRALVAARADLSAKRGEGMSPLLMAASTGHLEGCKALLELGADPWDKNNKGATVVVLSLKSSKVGKDYFHGFAVGKGSGSVKGGRYADLYWS